MKIKNNIKKARTYKWFLKVYYAFVWLVAIRWILIYIFGRPLKSSSILELSKWTFKIYLLEAIIPIIIIFSLITIFLALKKRIPKYHLIFPIYYIILILFWVEIIPDIIFSFAHSVEDVIYLANAKDSYWIIVSLINLILSSLFLWKLWKDK